jgi:hypothetical protein
VRRAINRDIGIGQQWRRAQIEAISHEISGE